MCGSSPPLHSALRGGCDGPRSAVLPSFSPESQLGGDRQRGGEGAGSAPLPEFPESWRGAGSSCHRKAMIPFLAAVQMHQIRKWLREFIWWKLCLLPKKKHERRGITCAASSQGQGSPGSLGGAEAQAAQGPARPPSCTGSKPLVERSAPSLCSDVCRQERPVLRLPSGPGGHGRPSRARGLKEVG